MSHVDESRRTQETVDGLSCTFLSIVRLTGYKQFIMAGMTIAAKIRRMCAEELFVCLFLLFLSFFIFEDPT